MNKSNHKAVGRYCYGGKIYVGQCEHCGDEHHLTIFNNRAGAGTDKQ